MVKYIHIRHWDYWWSVFGIVSTSISSVEFSLTDDKEGEKFYFHFDVYTLAAFPEITKPGEFYEPDDASWPYFMEYAKALEEGSIDYFVGMLYYEDGYLPDIIRCNQFKEQGKDIFSVMSEGEPPYYAVLFIREKRPLCPELILEWAEKLSPFLFQGEVTYKFADVPSEDEAREAYNEMLTEVIGI